jgi:hypothetical protein
MLPIAQIGRSTPALQAAYISLKPTVSNFFFFWIKG